MCSLQNLRFLRQKPNTLCSPFARKPTEGRQNPVRLSSLIMGDWKQDGDIGMKVIDFHLLRHKREVRRGGRFWYCWEASGCLCLMMEPFVGDSHISCL